ncbi:T6SS phospholipase effector Tle1-like catalytic domain-containing protein [Rugamonas rivuli]|uniref:T6SS Phospholipase effector Tle1-like catalytic domain-containing protein n=1 Tax=Rugamonas rivuli TaxID=2743358 RepID=A0A843SNV5_9BURK|nr:DUF2235 domain-containing protein [Rugamonas rivuli]MQA21936.1 hypothetical protein [Rugamonas rivuli]
MNVLEADYMSDHPYFVWPLELPPLAGGMDTFGQLEVWALAKLRYKVYRELDKNEKCMLDLEWQERAARFGIYSQRPSLAKTLFQEYMKELDKRGYVRWLRARELPSAPPLPVQVPPHKVIVFFADGTQNGFDRKKTWPSTDVFASNVLKMYRWLDGAEITNTQHQNVESERILLDTKGAQAQVAKYLHGVGNHQNFISSSICSMGGSGLIARLIRGYTFISRHYCPGDKIVLIGFSRGAYTVRALAEWIIANGLLERDEKFPMTREAAYKKAAASWTEWQRGRSKADAQKEIEAMGFWKELKRELRRLPPFFRGPVPVLTGPVPVDTVAVWDTVGSLGFNRKLDRSPDGQFLRTDLAKLTDEVLPQMIGRGIQALALDEQRVDFTPSLWAKGQKRITQCLFPGAHSDVGGGYKESESGLSDGALIWMQQQLEQYKVLKFGSRPANIRPDAFAAAHRPWVETPFRFFRKSQRSYLGRSDIELHASISDRYHCFAVQACSKSMFTQYRPPNIPYQIPGGPRP